MNLQSYFQTLEHVEPIPWTGSVTQMVGLLVESKGPAAAVGDFCEIHTSTGRRIRTQVTGFRNGRVLSMPLEETDGLQLGDRIVARNEASGLWVGPELMGRVLDGMGEPIDGGDPIVGEEYYELYKAPPSPLEREHITQPIGTGVRAIDGFLPCGLGQRVGIFGGSGVGKSTLLGSMCRHNSADVTVVALIGERNREVRDFVENEIGEEGRKRCVVVTATSDRPAPVRIRACFVAVAIAEYFRDKGANVLLIMDSVTRFAMAQREIGLASGEPPSQKGYTPSVFALMPKIFERAGNFPNGSITGFFTVLVEGDDFNEPICDAVRSILDGHIILSRDLAAAGHYPAIDILHSVSRLSTRVSQPEQMDAANKIRELMALYRDSSDLIQLGAHVAGVNPRLDKSIQMREIIRDFLTQKPREWTQPEETAGRLLALAGQI
ncbi:MAG: FliI/YscN family ATPase [Bryobacterales bacterium]|nr:FliI/YscN family ATPase [Bryobacterales bacterium]